MGEPKYNQYYHPVTSGHAMSSTRQSFSDRNSWHFAVAAAHPFASVKPSVLCEARLTDGAVIAEWDYSTNTGWMRSLVTPQAVPATDGHAGYIAEGAGRLE